MLPSVLLNWWQYSSLLLVTFPPDNWISLPLGKFRTNLPILRRKLLLMELWEARYLLFQRVQFVHQLVCHLWQIFCFGKKEAGRRALPCNSMQLAWQQLSFTLGVAKKSKALGLLMQLYTKLDSALQATAEYPAALSLLSCHIRSQKIIFPKKGETYYPRNSQDFVFSTLLPHFQYQNEKLRQPWSNLTSHVH